jgi:hypothetical protein
MKLTDYSSPWPCVKRRWGGPIRWGFLWVGSRPCIWEHFAKTTIERESPWIPWVYFGSYIYAYMLCTSWAPLRSTVTTINSTTWTKTLPVLNVRSPISVEGF